MNDEQKRRRPDEKREVSLPKLTDHWYIACTSEELSRRPIARLILDVPLVLFRGEGGRAAALLDRCPHRNVPLSAGRVVSGGLLECGYHGWRFDGGGICRLVPALTGPQEGRARRAPSFAVREQQGYVWVWATPDQEPTREPYSFPFQDDPRYIHVPYSVTLEGTLFNVLENALDVPHTAFLHRGLFRGGKKNRIEVVVKRWADRVEAEYLGEPRPTGVIGRLLAPGGGSVVHFDRFLLPSIAQIEYALGNHHLFISDVLTPVSDFETRINAMVSLKLPVGNKVARRVLTPLAKRVVAQDARILSLQTQNLKRFASEQFVSTDVDVLGPHILRLLKHGQKPEAAGEGAASNQPHESRLELMA